MDARSGSLFSSVDLEARVPRADPLRVIWDASTFAKNRDGFLAMDAAAELLAGVVNPPDGRRQMSRDHFPIDSTLIDAPPRPPGLRWASMRSFKAKDDPAGADAGRSAERDFRRQKRSNATHTSTSDPDARLYKKADGQPSRLCFVGTALMENRNGLVVDGRLTRASGVSECLSAVDLDDARIPRGGTPAGDPSAQQWGFDTADFVAELHDRRITPHIAQNV